MVSIKQRGTVAFVISAISLFAIHPTSAAPVLHSVKQDTSLPPLACSGTRWDLGQDCIKARSQQDQSWFPNGSMFCSSCKRVSVVSESLQVVLYVCFKCPVTCDSRPCQLLVLHTQSHLSGAQCESLAETVQQRVESVQRQNSHHF